MKIKLDTAKLDALIRAQPERANRIVRSGAFAVMGYAKTYSPWETGALRDSITTDEQSNLIWWVSDGVDYGIWQELGFEHWITKNRVAAHPFMVPAVEAVRPQYNAMWKEFFKV